MCEHVFVVPSFTADQIVLAMDQLHGVGNASKLEFLRMLDHLDRSEGWREDGATSLEDWVAYRYGMTWQAAADHVASMRALRDLPVLSSTFGMGAISWEVLVLLCTFVTAEEDEEWADRARRVSASVVRNHARAARRMRREEAARAHRKRFLSTSWDATGDFLRLNGLIPGAEGAMVKKTLDRIADQLGPGPDGAFSAYDERRADALVELVGARIADDRDPDRSTLVVHVDAHELALIDGKGHIQDGPMLPAEVVRRLACDARVEVVAHGPDGRPIGVGRVSRTVPPWLMRQLRERDAGCVICGRAAGNHAHHVTHWAHGGRTDLGNLVLLCRKCHRLVHECGFGLARDRFGDVRLIRPDRRPVMNRPTPLRPAVRERLLGPVRPRTPARRC